MQELAVEIERQNKAKKDYQANTSLLSVGTDPEGVSLSFEGSNLEPFQIGEIAHRKIGTYTGIPAKYYDRMLMEKPELLATNVNAWFHQESEKRMVHTLDGRVRAFLSNRYRRLDNYEVASAVLPLIADLPGATVESCEITERRMYIKVVNPRLEAEIQKGDIVQSGVVISNSEVGQGSVSVMPLVYRLVCLNGMVINDAATRRYHVGRANDAGENYELYSDTTLAADDQAFVLKMRDTVKAAVDEAHFSIIVDKMREAQGVKITGTDIPAVVELTAKEFGLTQEEGKGVLSHLIQGGNLSLYGLANAVTRHSQNVASYDRATELETAGYSILTIDPRLWTSINSRAAN